MTLRDNEEYLRVLLYSYYYHYYRTGGPPNTLGPKSEHARFRAMGTLRVQGPK